MAPASLVDLTHAVRPGIANPRDRPLLDYAAETMKTVEADGVQVLRIAFGNHIGTHLDFAGHLREGGGTAESFPLDRLCGEAVTISVPRGDNEAIDVRDLEAPLGGLAPDRMVLIRTGWEHRIGTSAYSDLHPYLTPEAAQWLVDREVKLVGIDVSSLECPFALRPPGFRHDTLRILLEAGIPALHNLANLAAIVGRSAYVAAFPIPFSGADGALVRAVAWVDGRSPGGGA